MAASLYFDLDHAIRQAGGNVPLVWVRSTDSKRYCNFGDAASAVVVSALTGRNILPQHFNDPTVRLSAIGTIGQNMIFGTVHMWGTGVDPTRRAFGSLPGFAAAPSTTYIVHAVRGPHTRRTLIDAGLHVPPIYGDPAWLLPRILRPEVEKRHDLGVIMHLSELESPTLDGQPKSIRYLQAGHEGAHLISTLHAPSWEGWKEKLIEILSCRRIASASLHGKIIADSYGIPNIYLSSQPGGAGSVSLETNLNLVDRRFADFYAGLGAKAIPAYRQPQSSPTAWNKIISAIDSLWQQPVHGCAETFFNAFPVIPRVSWSDPIWPLAEDSIAACPW